MNLPVYVQGKPHNQRIYLLEDNGNRQLLVADKWNVASNRTDGLCEIYDERTGMVSTVSVYIDKQGQFYIKKKARWHKEGPSKYYLDDFSPVKKELYCDCLHCNTRRF